MGLLDQVLRSALGGHQTGMGGGGMGGGGMGSGGIGGGASPILMALMALLASRGGGGGLGGMLGGSLGQSGNTGGFGGGFGSGSGGSLGGLGGLLEMFRQNGHGDTIDSWVGTGQNRPIAPDQLQEALGPQTVDQLSQQTGMPNHDLLRELSALLPGVIDKLTPQGSVPPADEQQGW